MARSHKATYQYLAGILGADFGVELDEPRDHGRDAHRAAAGAVEDHLGLAQRRALCLHAIEEPAQAPAAASVELYLETVVKQNHVSSDCGETESCFIRQLQALECPVC